MAHEAWSITTQGLTFPLRVGARWSKQFRGRYADAVGSSQVNIIFEIALNRDDPENPSFRARSACGGPFAPHFHANNPNDLARKWLAQTNQIDVAMTRAKEEGRSARGLEFLGFDNVNLVQHFIDVTPEFNAEFDALLQESMSHRGIYGGEVGDRQKRRRIATMLRIFEKALITEVDQDRDKAFNELIASKPFKREFGDLIESFYADKVDAGIVRAYNACRDQGHKDKARLLLSAYSSTHTREETMQKFQCSERQVNRANITGRLLTVPADMRPVIKCSTYSREIVDHFEAWALNPKQVMRAAGGKASFLLRANRHRLFLMYKDDCRVLGIKGMGQTNFYKFYSESIFKPMTRVCFPLPAGRIMILHVTLCSGDDAAPGDVSP